MNSTTGCSAQPTTAPDLAPDELAAWLRLATTPGVGKEVAAEIRTGR
ncbi:MAG: hypothetical protein GAK30_03452 [Paracidovorax wautersii]|uniref:Uncharacterized protein n=1 Tax=Paracidovorax wautersii TaxID=1177982 RepID=A0A7V8FL64_9BURK|nr:MAG: hypothetical protein GAK30_03452 [Paracidovorax wautersii]